MELPGEASLNKDNCPIVYQQPNLSASVTKPNTVLLNTSQQSLEKLTRPAVFDKMEALVKEMQDQENGVPVRQQKVFLTSIPYAFMGYDLIEWLMERLCVEESEALGIANQLCLHGYFFPVNDNKMLNVKDDSSLYRFQTPYYWPWQHKAPDNVEYAIYLSKRSLRNKQRHGLEDYESEALASLHKNLKAKWDFISMQAEEQVRLAKERKKGEKIVGDSQERAFWRVHRPPPGQFTPLEPCPIPSRNRRAKYKKRTDDEWQREVNFLKKLLSRTRLKMSLICESLVNYWETFNEYDFILQPALPSNPWVSEDITFWQLNNAIVDVPTEKRVKRWGISIEELVSDPTGLQEFTAFLEKEYSHENIRFWIAVNKLRRSAHSQISKKVNEIYEEFLKPGAPCEINIDGKTMEAVQNSLSHPSRFTFDVAAEHIYALLLKKDCYPRFVRSDHYKLLLASGIQPSHKKRFFGFGGAVKKKTLITHQTNQMFGTQITSGVSAPPSSLTLRRESDKSLTGSAHELTMISVKETTDKVPHSHSQSKLKEISYRLSNFEVHSDDQVAQADFGLSSKNYTKGFLEKNLFVSGNIEVEHSITKTTIKGLKRDSKNNDKLQDIAFLSMVSTSGNEELEKYNNNDEQSVSTCTTISRTKKDSTAFIGQGELSPVLEGSHELLIKNSFNEDETDVEFDLTSGCLAPVPTPAPSLAPLAEIEIEMDPIEEEQKSSETDELDEEIKVEKQNKEEKIRLPEHLYDNRNPVCPWEDEDNDSEDTTYVKTYATLGYL